MKKENTQLYFTKFKREKISQCNICKKRKHLSWDHIPPKGGIYLSPVEQETVFSQMTVTKINRKYSISQNGVKYRTICRECNEKIGRKFDPALNEFARGIGNILKSKLILPSIIYYKIKPNLLIRAILVHLLAAKVDIDKVRMDEQIRNFIFDDNGNIPEEINVFYWIHPYTNTVIIRDIAMLAIRGKFGGKVGFFSIFKYFPIAYLVCNLREYEGLNELTLYRNSKPQDIIDIPIHLNDIRGPEWPEIVDDGNMIVGGQSIQSSVSAIPKNKKKI
ncbi:MAG: hypothetical protein KAX30_08095 [Candidatus Atribacteria bacterium]|nr:hypothetical protein [Candidatus Atribacteria bacterium]